MAKAPKPIQQEPTGAPTPTSIQLTCPYAVMTEDGTVRSWPAGFPITDAADIAYLVGVGAEHIDLTAE